MRHYLTTFHDLLNWVDSATSGWDVRSDEDVHTIAEALRSGDHPAWGDDWTDYLEAEPDLTTFLPPQEDA